MAETSFASLSPTLLARKGGAKPAMRPQHAALAAMPAPADNPEQLEDLGWNDMGDQSETQQTAEIHQLTPASRSAPVTEPAVLRQREVINERIAPSAKARVKGDRAAFTLRLDADRHLKLRLACTVHDMSAQALVTQALDALLGDMPELDVLAAQVKRR
ncbi:hypothetical protein ACWPM1_09640 [Tsuneonella sp. HG249]